VLARAKQTCAAASLTAVAQNWLMGKAVSSYWTATGQGTDAFALTPHAVDVAEVSSLVLGGKLPLTH